MYAEFEEIIEEMLFIVKVSIINNWNIYKNIVLKIK